MTAGQGYDHVPTSQDYPRGGRSEMDCDLEGWPRGMIWPAANSSLSNCRYAGIVLLEEKMVSNILIDWHDICVKKAFIHMTPELLCKLNKLIQSSGWPSFT